MNFFKYRNRYQPEKGRLLVSEPFLPDPNFGRTVVLLCEHDGNGSFGFVLNKPSLVKVNEVVTDITNVEDIVYVGGPVQQDTLHFVHRNITLENAAEVNSGIFWGGDFEGLVLLADTQQISSSNIRFFIGYSGWGPGQLEEELKEDSWIVGDYASEELLFETDPEQMWKKALKNLGGRFSVYSNYPVDPRLN